MTKYVAIKEMSAGNDTVGEMWKEVKIFDGKATIEEVMTWGGAGLLEVAKRKNVTLAIADNDEF